MGKIIEHQLIQLNRLNKVFEKIGYACDAYLGHLTTSPKNLGTGLYLSCKLPLKETTKKKEDCIEIADKSNARVKVDNDHY
jgi:protein-arginine kinase